MPPAQDGRITQLYAAIELLEARCEARESELLRAERALTAASTATEAALRQEFARVLSVKDEALARAGLELQVLQEALRALSHGATAPPLPPGILA